MLDPRVVLGADGGQQSNLLTAQTSHPPCSGAGHDSCFLGSHRDQTGKGEDPSRVAEVADAQQRGDLAREMEPADLLTMVLAAALAWFWAAEGVDPREAGQSWSAQRLALHRAAVVEAARRISEPRTAGE
ncbi:hypothetical protein [Streptomyces sp. NPDC001851]|uniref:hypothetical protein n=1 Tax=Streptomyces sp. NPDC001851 TaxID=3154529 RepID=UPI00332A6867